MQPRITENAKQVAEEDIFSYEVHFRYYTSSDKGH